MPISDGNTFHSSGRVLGSVGCEDGAGAYTPIFSECDEYYEGCACDGEFCTNEVKKYYKADGWRLALSSDDTVISVHIPSGGPIDPDTVRRDLVRAGEIVRKSYGHFSAYYCSSWLLDPAILRATGKESNITRFASLFTRYPIKSDGSAVFIYVWGMSPDTDPHTIPDYNSFANSLRKYLCDGGHIYGSGGVFFEI